MTAAEKVEDIKEEQNLIPPASDEEELETEISDDNEEESEPIDLKGASETVREKIQEKVEKLEEFREENIFLGQQLSKPDLEQFQDNGIFASLPKVNGQLPYIGNIMLYHATDDQVEHAINAIDSREDLSAAQKRDVIRKIERYRGAFEDRKAQYEKQVEKNLQNAWQQEWAAVEEGFKKGLPDLDQDDIKNVWEWCKAQMGNSRKTKAACDASFDAKFELAVKAIRMLGIDKKLGKALSAEDRPEPPPIGKGGSRGLQRGAANAPSFTRAQLQKLLAHPEKVDSKTMAAINKALVEGRIKEK